MAITMDVHAELDTEALAVLSARVRNKIREAVIAGISDALGEMGALQIDDIAKAVAQPPLLPPGRETGEAWHDPFQYKEVRGSMSFKKRNPQ